MQFENFIYCKPTTNEMKLKCGTNNANEFTNLKEGLILKGKFYQLLNFSSLNLADEFKLERKIIFKPIK